MWHHSIGGNLLSQQQRSHAMVKAPETALERNNTTPAPRSLDKRAQLAYEQPLHICFDEMLEEEKQNMHQQQVLYKRAS
jgi:hypothetical protein